MSFLKRLLQRGDQAKEIVIVSGLPRSGTSMMMKMLEAGGIPPLTDQLRTADVDNPKGYYEFERVKKLDKGDYGWLPEGQGKAVKVISALLKHLPPDFQYKVIFMRRSIDEVLASQKKMLVHRSEATDAVSDEEMAKLYRKHLEQVDAWLASQPNISVLHVSYNTLLTNPDEEVVAVNRFLGGSLDVSRMVEVVDPALYRNRKQPL